MAKFSDKKFSGQSTRRTAHVKAAPVDKKALKEALDANASAEALFDKLAQMFSGEGVDYMNLAREIVNFTGMGNREDMTRAVMETSNKNPNVDPDKLMKIVTELETAQKPAPAAPAPVTQLPQKAPAPEQMPMAAEKSAQMDLMAPQLGRAQPQPKKSLQPVHKGMWLPRDIKRHFRKLRSMGYGIDNADMAVEDLVRQGAGGDGASDERVKDYFRRLWYSTISTKPHEESLYKLASMLYVAESDEDKAELEASLSGDTLSTEEMEGTGKIGQSQKAFQVQVQWQKPADPQMAKMMRDRMLKAVNGIPSIQVSEDTGSSVVATAWNTDEYALQKVTKAIQQQGGAVEVRRVAQAAPPAAPAGGMPAGDTTPMPPAGSPASGPAPAPADMMGDGMGEEELSLEEALEQLDEASKVVVEKVQAGETVDSDGHELVPEMPVDTGATPAPPGKVAVDSDAKAYWHDLYGDYGDQMTEDRVASIVDSIESVYGEHNIQLTDDQFGSLVAFVEEAVPGHSDVDLVGVLERTLLNYTASHKTHESGLDVKLARHAMHMAIHETGIKSQLGKYIAQKMKVPSVKGQPDDAVKVEKLKDEADKSEQTKQIAHIPMEYEDHQMRGKYLHLTVKWDSDAEAAEDRSEESLMQAVTSFVKGLGSQKEFKDFGFMGQINFSEFDADAGLAEVYVLTSKGADAVPVVETK